MRKKTIASIRIKQELRDRKMSARELARLSGLGYSDIENILASKSSKIEKIETVAKIFNKSTMYFITPNHEEGNKESNNEYDAQLHYKTIKIINDVCKKKNIFLTKERMDKIVDFAYPRLQKTGDGGELAVMEVEAVINYVLKKERDK